VGKNKFRNASKLRDSPFSPETNRSISFTMPFTDLNALESPGVLFCANKLVGISNKNTGNIFFILWVLVMVRLGAYFVVMGMLPLLMPASYCIVIDLSFAIAIMV